MPTVGGPVSADWLAVGKRVAIISHGGTGKDRAYYRMVERLTRTQAVLEGGMKFNRSSLREVGAGNRGAWLSWWELTYETDPRLEKIQKAQRKAAAEFSGVAMLKDAVKSLRSGDLTAAKAHALTAIEQIDRLAEWVTP
jgi:hypothetical protein